MSQASARAPQPAPADNGSPYAAHDIAPTTLPVDLTALLAELGARLAAAGSVPLSLTTSRPLEGGEMLQIVIFSLGDTRYAVEIRYVTEIARRGETTHVPGLPTWVLGVINLHGEIVSVVDLGAFLHLDIPAERHSRDMLLVVQAADQKIGLIVDNVEPIFAFPSDEILSLPLRDEPQLVPYLRGAVEQDGHLIRLLDGERLLLGPEMQQFA